MAKYLTARFIALYIALTIVTLCAVAGAVALALAPGVAHRVAKVEAQLGDTNLTRLAAKYVAQQAQDAGFAVVRIKTLNVAEKGDTASVKERVTVTDGYTQQTVTLVVSFSRGVWSATSMARAK